MRVACLILLVPVLAQAQIQDLATTDDGAQLYFSSTLRQKGTDQYTNAKIFRYTDGRFELFRQEKTVNLFAGSGITNPSQLILPDVSGDGQAVAYTGVASCAPVSACIGFVRNTGYLAGVEVPPAALINGRLQISRDKRVALRLGSDGVVPGAKNALIELASGAVTDLSMYGIGGDGRQSLADNGVVLLTEKGALSLWRNGTAVPTGINTIPLAARIDRKAGMIVYETGASAGAQRLASFNVATGRETLLAEGYVSPFTRFRPSLSSDGTLVLYLDAQAEDKPAQVFVQSTNGSGKRQLTQEQEGMVEAVLSGNGNVAYAVASSGSLLRIDVASGGVTQLLSSPPQIHKIFGFAPGSFSRVMGANLLDADVRVGHLMPPVLARTPSEIDIQIPWETPTDSASIVVSASTNSAFESALDMPARAMAPQFEDVAVHQAFDGLVTAQAPAKAGEIVHFYAAGLGAVTPAVATGQVTPATELHKTVSVPSCSFAGATGNVPARVLFSGLTPGLIGIYQMDIMVPSGIMRLNTYLICIFPVQHDLFFGVSNNIAVAP